MQLGKWTLPRILLVVFLFVLGIGALAPGWLLFTRPDGSGMGMPASWLAGSPFPDYTIPGFVLFTLFGVGSFIIIYGVIFQPRWRWTEPLTKPLGAHWAVVAAALIGIGQLIWIIVEVLVIPVFSGLQPALFTVGLVILLMALWTARTQRQTFAAPAP